MLRGLAMVIMALDHTRDFLSYARPAPEDLAHTTGALFFTRVVTHYCASIFAFLAGTGAFLSTRRGKSIPQVSRFFLTRGLWLVLLELTIVDFAWGFVPWAHAGVIWGLGLSMAAMALIVWLPLRWVAVLGLSMIATHNLLDRINPASFGKFSWLWMLLHSPGRIPITANFSFSVRYVLIPWIGVMAAGFAFGKLLLRHDHRKWILMLGVAATALFFVLREINAYGNGIAGTAIWIRVFCRSMEHSTHAFADRDFILQHPEISAISRLFAHDARSLPHLARTAGRSESREGPQPRSPRVRPSAAVLLHLASLSHSHSGDHYVTSLSPTRLAWNGDCRRSP
jgi:uncharacterized membrane protein